MRQAAVWVMSLLPATLMAQDFTPDMFPGQSPDRTELEVSATVQVGDFGTARNTRSYVTAISSSNEQVVKVFNEYGYTAVLFTGVGTADVTYTETIFTEGDAGSINLDGPATNHIIHYTVGKGVPTTYWAYQDETITSFRLVWEGNDWGAVSSPEPKLIVKEMATDNYGRPYMKDMQIAPYQMNLESSNPEVATVSMRGVTPVGYGKATITATWTGSELWEAASFSYEVSVVVPKETVHVDFFQTEVTGFIGDQMAAPLNLQMLTIDRWESEHPEVASVDETTGRVTFNAKGTTRIFAYVNETDEHYDAQGFYTVHVRKHDAELSFSEPVAYGEPNVPFTAPTLINPHNVAIDKWYSSAPDVAEVNEATGEVTVKAVGDATIYCESNENDTYERAIASYLLHSAAIGLQVMGIEVTSLNCDDVLGDGSKKVTFDKETRTLTLNDWTVDAAGIGNINVREHVIWNQGKETLVINPLGECAITNAHGCVVSMMGALVFLSSSKDGKLTLTANETTQSIAVQADHVKVHECDVTAIGSVVGMKVGGLTVSKQSHLYTEAAGTGGYAGIVCGHEFLIAGEGIQILTPGVHYDKAKKGFYDDEANTIASKVVEIGKVPVVVSEVEETVIEFSVTDPDDNDAVVFSTSGNDTYNPETGQIEISTSLTDEQVATALETLIPGSSAWVSMLPGSLVFDVPAGKGEIQVNCLTLPGYTLNIMIDGQGAISITQASLGWATIAYDVAAPTHVVIYLHASSAEGRALAADRAPSTANAYIQALKITPSGAPSAVETIRTFAPADGKYLYNGRLYIVRNGQLFNASGIQVK